MQAVCSFEETHEEAHTQGINTREVIFLCSIDLYLVYFVVPLQKLQLFLQSGCSVEKAPSILPRLLQDEKETHSKWIIPLCFIDLTDFWKFDYD